MMHAPVPKAKAESRTSRRDEVIRLAKHYWYVVLNPKDQSFIRAPWPTAADKITKPDGSIPAYDRPRFDLGVFSKKGRLPDYVDHVVVKTSADSDVADQLRTLAKSAGATLPATWENGNVANPSGKVTAKFGSSSYAKLFSESRRPPQLGWATVTVCRSGLAD